MKRFAALTLVLVLIFALTVSVGAKDSPTGKQYYSINTRVEGDGIIASDPIKVEKGTDGKVTLTATDGKGFFTRWIITGDYDIVDGSIEDPVFTIIPKSDLDVIGNFSEDEEYLHMYAYSDDETLGEAYVDIPVVKKGSDTVVTFTAVETNGTFIEWTFECDFKLVSGDTKSKEVKIIPYTDVTGIAYFKTAPAPDKRDDSESAPKTGDPLPYVAAVMLLALGAAVVSVKKLKKD